VGAELSDPEVPGVGLSLWAQHGEVPCRLGSGTAAGVDTLRVYVDGQLEFSEDRNCDPIDGCWPRTFGRHLQMRYADVLGSHTIRVEATDQLGNEAKPLEYEESTPEAGTIYQRFSRAEDLKGSKACETPKVRDYNEPRRKTLSGTDCADIIKPMPGVKNVHGGPGDDIIRTGGNVNNVYGEDDNDLISTGRGNDKVYGGDGDDRLVGGAGDDRILSGGGGDVLIGGAGADFMRGQTGNDVFRGGTTSDTLFGEGGDNTLSYADAVEPGFEFTPGGLPEGFPPPYGERGVYIDLSGIEGKAINGFVARFGGGTDNIADASEFSRVIGSPFSDIIIGSPRAEVLGGGGGTDVIEGGGGGDKVFGGADNDFLESAGGELAGGGGANTCVPGSAAATACGEAPVSLAPPSGVNITVGVQGDDAGELPIGDVYLRGSDQADIVEATWASGSVTFKAKGKAGSSGRFKVTEEQQNGCEVPKATEAICPGSGSILMNGRTGRDHLKVEGFPHTASVTELGGADGDVLNGGESDDILVDGTDAKADKLHGFGGDDALFANAGKDELTGGDESDLFISSVLCDGDKIRGGDAIDNAAWAQLAADPLPDPETDPFAVAAHGVSVALAEDGEEGTIDQHGEPCSKGTSGSVFGVENIEGSHAGDSLTGNDEPNVLLGRGGQDILSSEGGDDKIFANNADSSVPISDPYFFDEDTWIGCGWGQDKVRIDEADKGHFATDPENDTCEEVKRYPGVQARPQLPRPAAEAPTWKLDEEVIGALNDEEALSPVAFFRLDEASGTEAENWSDNEASGSYGGGAELGGEGALSESLGAHLDGNDDYLDLTGNWDPAEYDPGRWSCGSSIAGYTVEMWVKFDGEPEGREELYSRSEGSGGSFLYRSPDGKLNFSVAGSWGAPVVSTDGSVEPGQWHHVVAALTDNPGECPTRLSGPSAFVDPRDDYELLSLPGITLYVDGFPYSLGLMGESPFPAPTPSAHHLIGARAGSEGLTNWLNGSIDDVAIYDKSLPEADVDTHLFNSFALAVSTLLEPPPNWQDMDEDGVGDRHDNCEEVANTEQDDADEDGIGDACEAEHDSDEDGIPDKLDNCPNDANAKQEDADENEVGDVCEPE
jgi:Ca2+-binding RTX toxin-like protein